jgi:hypothetical protein
MELGIQSCQFDPGLSARKKIWWSERPENSLDWEMRKELQGAWIWLAIEFDVIPNVLEGLLWRD